MSGYITLMGAEQVERAASRIAQAAETFDRAVGRLEDLHRLQQIAMEDWLVRLRLVLERELEDEK